MPFVPMKNANFIAKRVPKLKGNLLEETPNMKNPISYVQMELSWPQSNFVPVLLYTALSNFVGIGKLKNQAP